MSRLLRGHRNYFALSTSVLAVAIGANLLVFTIVNALWIRPLPFADPERVVTIPRVSFERLDAPELSIFEGRVAGQVLTADRFGGLGPQIDIIGVSRDIETLAVTPGYFELLGLTIRGRDFTVQDDQPGTPPVAIISDRLWSLAFGRRADAIGAEVDAKPFKIRIIGVAPPGFEGARRGERADVWIPRSLARRLASNGTSAALPLMVFARLSAGQTAPMMERRYRELMNPRDRAWFLANAPTELPEVVPVKEVFGTPQTRTFMIDERGAVIVVSGLALIVLFGGCATIAALVLVHYERRRGEFALKVALGASRIRLVRELARDLLLVALSGATGGILTARLGCRVIPALSLPGGVDVGRLDLSIDWRVCFVAVVASITTLSLAAALPVTRSTRPRVAGDLSGGTSVTLASHRVRQALLSLQVCATVVVLIAAGLFVRAVIHGFERAPGFDVSHTVFVSVQERAPHLDPSDDWRRLITERTARLTGILRDLPGVTQVAEGRSPIGPDVRTTPTTIVIHGRELTLLLGRLSGSPELLGVLGVPLLAGRQLTAADSVAVPIPAVITASLGQRLWPGGGALGQTLSIPQLRRSSYLVVGIARDMTFGSLSASGNGVIITTQPPSDAIVSTFVIRTDSPEVVAGGVQRAVQGQVVKAVTGREIIAHDLGRQRLGAWFFSGFGLAALLLGVGGTFGLVSYLAESQRRDFGVRLALGARMGDLLGRGLLSALVPVSVGIVTGLIVAAVMSQLFTSLLAGISPLDYATYSVVTITLLGCTTIAALTAAWRLRRLAPTDALRRA